MAYDNNTPNNRDNYEMKNKLNESEEQRTRRQNRIGLAILAVVLLAFVGGYIATMDKRNQTNVATPATAENTTGANESAIAPAAGNPMATTGTAATSTTSEGDTVAATANAPTTSAPATDTTEPATENPKVYTSEETCRSMVNGACQPVSGGWTPVNPAPEKTAVPENMAPPMTATSPSDTSTK